MSSADGNRIVVLVAANQEWESDPDVEVAWYGSKGWKKRFVGMKG